MKTRRKVLKYVIGASALAATGAATLLPRKANAYYSGPPSDHFDGTVFFNSSAEKPRGFQHFLKMQLQETWAEWPERIESPFADTPPAEAPGAATRVSYVGHASWLIQAAGLNILVDPVWSERASPFSFAGPKRVNPPGVAFDELPRIDVILVTHNHYDHLDLATLGRLWTRNRPRVVTPLGNDAIMRPDMPGLVAGTLDWHQSVTLSPSVRVSAVPTLHWSARGLRDRRHALWASFVLETPAGTIYVVGDSGFGDGATFLHVAKAHPSIDLALLPIGAYEPRWFMKGQHMNPAEAVEALQLSGAKAALGHHWGTFQLTAEDALAPAHALAAARAEKGIPEERFPALRPGQVHVLGR